MNDRIHVWVQRFTDRATLQLQWFDREGRRRTRSARTADEQEAEQARADLEYELAHGMHASPTEGVSWLAFREAFEREYVAGRRPNTQRNYEATLDLFERLARPTDLQSIIERTISAFTAALRREPGRKNGSAGMLPGTVKVRLQFLHTALTWAVEQKMLAAVPRFPAVKVPKKDPQPVPHELYDRLTAVAGDDQQMLVYLACGWLAGLRLAEAFELRWEETTEAPYLDFSRRRIVLPAEMVKADRDQWVPLDPTLAEMLRQFPRQGDRVFRFLDSQGEPLLAGGVSQRIVRLARRAGVRLTMKALRRGFGCRYAGKVSAHVLQKLMRHASLKTTMDFYCNVDLAVEQAVLGVTGVTPNEVKAACPGQRENGASPDHDSLNSPAAD